MAPPDGCLWDAVAEFQRFLQNAFSNSRGARRKETHHE